MHRRPRRTTPAGHGTDVWLERIGSAPVLDIADLAVVGSRLLVVSAHPDDETIGAGRLLAAWARTVGPVVSVVLSAGEACVDHMTRRPDGIAARRVAEWQSATRDLEVRPLGCCGLPDGELAEREDVIAEVVGELVGAVDAVCSPWSRDPHPDRAAAGRAVTRVAAETGTPMFSYPVWTTYWSEPDVLGEATLVRMAHEPADEASRALALSRYRSQLEPLAPGIEPVVPGDFLEHHMAQLLVGAA